MVAIGHVHGHKEGWGRDKDELKTPETNVGNRKEVVITDVLTTRLEHRETDISY